MIFCCYSKEIPLQCKLGLQEADFMKTSQIFSARIRWVTMDKIKISINQTSEISGGLKKWWRKFIVIHVSLFGTSWIFLLILYIKVYFDIIKQNFCLNITFMKAGDKLGIAHKPCRNSYTKFKHIRKQDCTMSPFGTQYIPAYFDSGRCRVDWRADHVVYRKAGMLLHPPAS